MMFRELILIIRLVKNLILRRPKRIALVGNHECAIDFSREIESCDYIDYIVRIDTATHCGQAGTRTDALAVINWSSPAFYFISGAKRISQLAICGAKEYWIPMPPDEMLRTKLDQANPPPFPAYQDFTTELTQHLLAAKRARVIYFPPNIWASPTRELRRLGADQTHAASMGSLVLAYIHRVFPKSKIEVFGFTHEGWPGHPWEAEEKWIRSLDRVKVHRIQSSSAAK